MRYLDIVDVIKSMGLPVAYEYFTPQEKTAPPFICYYFLGDNDLHADNCNYQPVRTFNIDLYTKNKDFTLEQSVENTLKAACLSYTRDEQYIDDEKLYLTAYTIQAVITEE